MSALLAFVRLTRPHFLLGGVAGFALGVAVAHAAGAPLTLPAILWGQGLVTSFHLMTHYANEFFDRAGDAVDDRRTPFSGGSGVLVAGLLPPQTAIVAALACAAAGLGCCVHFALAHNATTALVGVGIGIGAWIYSAPPLRLVGRGLGELDTVAVVAVLVPAAGYAAMTGRVDGLLLRATVGTAAAMFAMMLCVEFPDCGGDRISGKRTLAVRWGPSIVLGRLRFGLIAVAGAIVAAAKPAALGLWLALVPIALAAALWLVIGRDPVPRRIAVLGVGLYGVTALTLACAYALGLRAG